MGTSALADLIRGARNAVMLTGAGVSTESGLPDYRGDAGLWKNRRFEQLANIEAFRANPVEFWEFYAERLAALRGAAPNPGHRAIARLQQAGKLAGLVTQNVDGLHAAAGSDAIEVHGSLARAVCIVCGGEPVPADEAERRMALSDDGVPRCGRGHPLKPDVTLFGEMLPVAAIERAIELVDGCDVLVVAGSSLEVAPVSALPWHAADRGARVAIVNTGPTSYDPFADLRVASPTGSVLPLVADALCGPA